jgi:membrane fusion protein (multidrug efflux system)
MNHESTASLDGTPLAVEPSRRVSRRGLIVVAASIAIAAAGAWWIISPRKFASTDDAYFKADSTSVAPKIRGIVAEVFVQDNQTVKSGTPLARIDSEEFDAKVSSAAAELQTAEAAVDSAKAALVSLGAEERLAESNVRAVQTAIKSADAQSGRAVSDRARYDRLVETGAVSRRDVDLYGATAVSAVAEAERSRALLDVSMNQTNVIRAKRASLLAAQSQALAAVERAKAMLTLARQDKGYTVIRAPVDGVVGDRQIRVGDYVQPGSRLLTLVPLHDLYIVANFKETQTGRMVKGAPTTVEVDALPGAEIKGEVESFAPGSGSQFSLLPFEPGTGNFTKIVQRIPVRIKLNPNQPDVQGLRPGLSANVTVSLQPPHAN